MDATMPLRDLREILKANGGVDITPGMEIVSSTGEWPLHDIYWALREYKSILEIGQKTFRYWTDEDFMKSKSHREQSARTVSAVILDTVSKKITLEQSAPPAKVLPSGAPQPKVQRYTDHFACRDPGGRSIKTSARIKGTRAFTEHEEQEVYRDLRCDMGAYVLEIPNGKYHVELKFCEIEHQAAGQRVFGVKVQGIPVIDRLDIFQKVGRNRAFQVRSADVRVTEGLLRIEFTRVIGFPCIAAISVGGDIDGATNSVERIFYQHINCGGPSFRGYYADFGFDR